MRKISLPEQGIETLYGAHDTNLKHIESLLNVGIRTHGSELTIEGAAADEQRALQLFDQLRTLMAEGYSLQNGDVKTAADLLAENADVDLREYFGKGTSAGISMRSSSSTSCSVWDPQAPAKHTWRWRRPSVTWSARK